MVGAFIDFENIFWGMKRPHRHNVSISDLMEKIEKYGRFAVGYAVADWSERRRDGSSVYPERLKRDLRAAGIEAVDAPKSSHCSNKNMADIKLATIIFSNLTHRKDIGTYLLMSSDGIYVDVVNLIKRDFGRRIVIAGVPPISKDLVYAVGEANCDPLHFDPVEYVNVTIPE
jgi:NYN domain